MPIFNFFKKNKKEPIEDFNSYLNNQFEYLQFSETQKNGVAFIMGLTLPISSINSKIHQVETSIQDNHKKMMEYVTSLLDMYAEGNFDWNESENLNLKDFQSLIYNFNFIMYKCLAELDINIDDNLKQIPELNIIVGKTELDKKWVDDFFELKYNLKNVNALYYEFIEKAGDYLSKADMSSEESYIAGKSLYFHMLQHDINGGHFLISTLANRMPPLLDYLSELNILFKYHNSSLKANHIFSSIFQFYSMGIEPEILSPVHRWHQMVFYEAGTAKFRDAWDFNKIETDLIIAQTLKNAVLIRENELFNQRNNFLNSNEIYDDSLKGATIDLNSFSDKIQDVIYYKHGYTLDLSKRKNTGEYMEIIAILFYETCLHAMVLEELTE